MHALWLVGGVCWEKHCAFVAVVFSKGLCSALEGLLGGAYVTAAKRSFKQGDRCVTSVIMCEQGGNGAIQVCQSKPAAVDFPHPHHCVDPLKEKRLQQLNRSRIAQQLGL